MQLTDLDALIDKTATLMMQYERRSAAVDARLRELAETLDALGQRLPDVMRTSADGLVREVPAQVAGAVSQDLDGTLRDYRSRILVAGDEVARSTRSLALELGRVCTVQRLLVWKALAAIAAALALLLGGGAWLGNYYVGVVRANQLSAEVMQAYHRADVVLCGRGELCANVDASGVRYGEHGQYHPVKRR